MTNEKLSPLQKFFAFIFALLFVASLVFIGRRIFFRGAYVRHEKEQCRLLAVSAADSLAAMDAAMPGLWCRLASGDVQIILDRKLIRDNWNISAAASPGGGGVSLLVNVKSGWNSRSPQEYSCRARISGGGIIFADLGDARTATVLRAVRPGSGDKILAFIYPDERLVMPVSMPVSLSAYSAPPDGGYIIIKKASNPKALPR